MFKKVGSIFILNIILISRPRNDEASDAMDFADMPALVEISGAEFVAETATEEVWSGVEAEREGCPGGEVEER